MRTLLITVILIIFPFGLNPRENARLHGRVTDFEGNPIDSVSIRL